MCDHNTAIVDRFGTCWSCAKGSELETIDEAAKLDPVIVAAIEAEVSKVWGPTEDDEQ